MRSPRLSAIVGAAALVAIACNDRPLEPDTSAGESVYVLIVHRQNSGENFLLRTDGGSPDARAATPTGLLPVGASAQGGLVAMYGSDGTGPLRLLSLDRPDRLDTIIHPGNGDRSLASFSADGRYVAVVSYEPTGAILVYDRANRAVDTIPYGSNEPSLPPLISPDNGRLAVITVTQLSMYLTVVDLDQSGRSTSHVLGFSRLVNRPIWGWPRWTDDGIHLAFLRLGGEAPDTLLVGTIDPDIPDGPLREEYRAVMRPVSDNRPGVLIRATSTYALAGDGRALVLGADPGTGGTRHAIYLVTPDVDRVQLLLDDPDQFPVFPLFLR